MTSYIPQELLQYINNLPRGLQSHLCRAREVARELALIHRIDVHRAELGALAHDILRATKPADLQKMASEKCLAIHPVEAALPVLLHRPLAARLLEEQFGITDAEVLEGVYWHSTATRGLSPLGIVIFLADKLDPEKIKRNPSRQCLKDLALQDLDRAMLAYLTGELISYLHDGGLVHPSSIEARNELVGRVNLQS